MVLKQPRTPCNNRLPTRQSCPARSPTDNRSSLNPSPETEWAFDFVPTATSISKRRGKRGGKQQRLEHALKRPCEHPKPDISGALCHHSAAQRPDDDEHTAAVQTQQREVQSDTPSRGFPSSVNAVRHQWAPQFRPDSLPTSEPTVLKPTNIELKNPSQGSQRRLPVLKSAHRPHPNGSPNNRNAYPRFPLSAFLKDLTSPSDSKGYWPPKPPEIESTPLPCSGKAPDTLTAASPPASAQSIAAAAACRALVLSKIRTLPSSATFRTYRTEPLTLPLSINTKSNYARFPAFPLPPSAVFRAPNPVDSSALTLLPTPTTAQMRLSSQAVSLPVVSTATPIIYSPSVAPVALSPAPMDRRRSNSRPSCASALQGVSRCWQEVSEAMSNSHTPPSTLVAAPITSQYPFAYPPQPWTPTAVSKELFKDTAAGPSILRRNLASNPPTPEAQRGLREFLVMGHADDCWCASSTPPISDSGVCTASTAIEDPQSKRLIDACDGTRMSSDLDVQIDVSQISDSLSCLQPDTEDDSSDSDAVIVTSSLEGSGSGSKAVFVFDEDTRPSASDDEWIAISPRLKSRRPCSVLSSRTTSSTSRQTLSSDHVAQSLNTSLSSPAQVPVMLAYQARVVDAESETD